MIDRRGILLLAGGSVAVLANTQSVSAQDGQRDPDIIERLATAERRAEAILDAVTEVAPLAVQLETASVAMSIEELAASAVNQAISNGNDGALLYVRPAEYALALEMIERDAPLLPEERVEFDLGRLDPTRDPPEERWDVLKDMIAQVLLGSGFSNYLQFRTALTILGLDDLFARLLVAIRDRSWATAASLVRRILVVLVSARALEVLESQIGQSATRRMLARMGSKFVPFIGWALLVASVTQACKDNWERLSQAQ